MNDLEPEISLRKPQSSTGKLKKMGKDSEDTYEEVDNMLWSTLELLSELRVLCSNTDGARIQMTLLKIPS